MHSMKLVKIIALCLLLCLLVCGYADDAYAQKGGGGDKDLASKKGLSVLSAKKSDPTKAATKTQKTIGIASIFVMIAVVKWL